MSTTLWYSSNSAYGEPRDGPLPKPGTRRQGQNGHFATDVENWNLMSMATRRVTPSREEALRRVRKNGRELLHLGAFKDDREIVLAAVKRDSEALRWADPAQRADRSVVLAAVTAFPKAIQFASTFRDDRKIALAAVSRDGNALQYLRALQNDKEVVIAALRNSPKALQYASKRLQSDDDVLAAARANSPSRRRPPPQSAVERELRAKEAQVAKMQADLGHRIAENERTRKPILYYPTH